MEHIQVIKATIDDLSTVQQIGRETFFETFADSNTEDDMNKYLEDSFNADKVTIELSNPNSLFYIAWDDESPVGYLKVNTGTAQTEQQDERALEIERIYVKSSHHGKKVGPRAIRFYEKNGFIAFDKHVFKMGEDEQLDIMMKKEIKSN
jgi:ribosomal protein S18 acetylase RimI-like enzyme